MDCTLEFIPPSEVQLRRSLDGKGVVDLDIDEFAGLDDKARQKAIARRDFLDKKKEARVQVTLQNKEKKASVLAQKKVAKEKKASVLAQKKVAKEKEGQGKGKGKAKKKDEGGAEVVPSCTTDGASQMPSAVKRKATLSQLTEEVITHVTQAMVIAEDDLAKTEDLILNISIEDLVNDMSVDSPMWYKEVLEFMKKVLLYRSYSIH